MVSDFLAVDTFDFTRKIVKKILCKKLVKMLGFCQNQIFEQKFDFSNSVLTVQPALVRVSRHDPKVRRSCSKTRTSRVNY